MPPKLKFVKDDAPDKQVLMTCVNQKCLMIEWSARLKRDSDGKPRCKQCGGQTAAVIQEDRPKPLDGGVAGFETL